MEQEPSGIFIQFSYNANEIVGIDEFKKELDPSYLYVSSAKWFPSCTSGGEFWLNVFFGGSFQNLAVELIQSILIGGVIKFGKKYVLTPLIEALKNLRKANEAHWGLNMQTTSLLFDDIQVVIGGWQESAPNELIKVFRQIVKAKDIIYFNAGIPLERIELPCNLFKYGDFWSIDGCREPGLSIDNCVWRLTYQDSTVLFYDSGKECIVETC